MIIEFFGKIGSGKSSLARELCKIKKFNLIKINSRIEKYPFAIIFMFLNPYKTIFLIKESFKGRYRLRKISLVLFNMARYQKAKMKKGINVLEEGFLQAIFSVLDYSLTRDKLNDFLKNIPMPDKLVILEINEKIRLDRIKKRGYDMPEIMFRKDYGKIWHKTMVKNYPLIKKEIEKKINFLKINNNSSIKKSAQEIVKKFENEDL